MSGGAFCFPVEEVLLEEEPELDFDELFGARNDLRNSSKEDSHLTSSNSSFVGHEAAEFEEDSEGRFSVNFSKPEDSSKVCLEDFEIIRLIGKGAYGKVHLVSRKDTNETYAMKVLRKEHLIQTNNVSYTLTERNILRNIRHPFISSLHYAFQTDGKVYLVMDYVSGGQLFYHMRKHTMFSEDEVRFYAAELVLCLEYLHSQNIVHRDLKPENILVRYDGHLCLADFGLAKVDITSPCSGGNTFCGTIEYMAPEIIKGEGHGMAVDWWSLGILIFDMLTGSPPFMSNNRATLQDKILKGKFRVPKYISSSASSLIKGFLKPEPLKRLGSGRNDIQAIKLHHFFKGVNWDKTLEEESSPPFKPDLSKDPLCCHEKKFTKLQPGDSPLETMLSQSQQKFFNGFSYVRSFDEALKREMVVPGNSPDSPTPSSELL